MSLAMPRCAPLRVLVVEDSATQRHMLVSLLEADAEMQVVGVAASGGEAVRAATRLRPDVITMDLRLPDMDGLEATRQIMQEAPAPIVVVTAHASPTDEQAMFECLQAGALGLVEKPYPGAEYEARRIQLLRAVKSMARVRVVRRRARSGPAPSPESLARPVASFKAAPQIVAIGASTGGPQALQQILTALPAGFPLPVLVVQHMAPGFLSSMVRWLRPQCALPIELAGAGDRLEVPRISVAPTGQHLIVRGGAIHLTDDAPVRGHRPSATKLFQSVGREYGAHAVGVLLTGMGDDGAAGMRDLKSRGAVTIAQDEASSIVFGMPGAAIGLGAADYILPPAQIASTLIDLARQTARA